MNKVINNNYDLLWKWGVPYIFISIYLESGYTKTDSISYNEGTTNYLFIAKNERVRLSKKGFILYTRDFDKFKRKLQANQQEVINYLKQEKKVNISKFDQKQLINGFITMAKNLREAWAVYFPAEIHSYDLVAIKMMDENYPKQISLNNNIKIMSALRQKQRDIINQIMYPPGPFDKYYQEITRRLKKDINHLNYKEVILLLQGKKIINKKQKFIMVGKFTNWDRLVGLKAKKFFKQLLPLANNVRELRGTIGNKGYYRGKVRKIDFSLETNYPKEMAAMKKGEVLISGSTGPEIILACKKAGAIVTEEGGILSHATIVSRELGIPCIISTKIVTKIFKTGDSIEVDANKGIVRKL